MDNMKKEHLLTAHTIRVPRSFDHHPVASQFSGSENLCQIQLVESHVIFAGPFFVSLSSSAVNSCYCDITVMAICRDSFTMHLTPIVRSKGAQKPNRLYSFICLENFNFLRFLPSVCHYNSHFDFILYNNSKIFFRSAFIHSTTEN